jgi:hypothetical protein
MFFQEFKRRHELRRELIQIRPNWCPGRIGFNENKWARIHPRFLNHPGCIVDVGCLGWNDDYDDPKSDNWSGYFIDKKRVIGVDPQERPNPSAELFRGFITNANGRADLSYSGISATIAYDGPGEYETITFHEFRRRFQLDKIAVLKINIEGSKWPLIEGFSAADLEGVDQICISFHDFLQLENESRNFVESGLRTLRRSTFFRLCGLFQPTSCRTKSCIQKIKSYGYYCLDLGVCGWKLFIKKRVS